MLETAETIKGHRATLAAVGLVVAIGALLRFHNLGGESLWGDEAASWTQAKDSLADLIKRTADDNYPPLHNLALFAAIKLFGDSEVGLPPSVGDLRCRKRRCPLLARLNDGRPHRRVNRGGPAGAVTVPFRYSQEARMYSLMALAATLYAATCFHYLRAPSLRRGAWVSLAGLALVYSHPYGALDWIAIVVAFAVFVLPATSPPPRTCWSGRHRTSSSLRASRHGCEIRGPRSCIRRPWYLDSTADLGFSARRLRKVVGGGKMFAGVILIGIVLGGSAGCAGTWRCSASGSSPRSQSASWLLSYRRRSSCLAML